MGRLGRVLRGTRNVVAGIIFICIFTAIGIGLSANGDFLRIIEMVRLKHLLTICSQNENKDQASTS